MCWMNSVGCGHEFSTAAWVLDLVALEQLAERERDVARMIQSHLDNVLTYFDHRITNATSECSNWCQFSLYVRRKTN